MKIVFDGEVESEKIINLFYDEASKYYHVINSVTGALNRKYVCKSCNKGFESCVTHRCPDTCSDSMSVPPCPYADVRISCESCNREFRSSACFDKQKTNKLGGKSECEQKRNCDKCNRYTSRKKRECFKPYCPNRYQKKEIGQFCFLQPLKNELSCSHVLFVFYDFETTQDTKFSKNTNEHIQILVRLQQFCEMHDDIDVDCERCGWKRHSFYADPVGDLLSYLCEPRP